MGQKLFCPAQPMVVPPPPVVANVIGTWSYRTVSRRMASILRTVLATFARDELALMEQIGAFGRESVELVESELEELLDSLMNNRCLKRLTGEADDVAVWNRVLEEATVDGVPPAWHDGEWLYVECYMYRRLYDILDTSGVLQDYDYFREKKVRSLEDSIGAANELGDSLVEDLTAASALPSAQTRADFEDFLLISLWGNQCDMSLSGGADVSQDKSPRSQLQRLAKYVLVDHTQRIFAYLCALRSKRKKIRIDFISDNAGFELFADLCLADFLSEVDMAQRVTFHVKQIPWFVSDATRADVTWLLERMRAEDSGSLPALAKRWQQQFSSGVWEVVTSSFWTSPFPFSRMQQESPDLYWRLQGADLVLVKGDLNYRKLLADRPWPISTPFCRSLGGFHPAPLVALRVLKADIVSGLPHKRARYAARLDPNWMTCGKFAVVQLCKHVTPLDMF